MDAITYDPDPKTHEIIAEAIGRLDEHVRHVLGNDPGCGLCLWCVTCKVRIMAKELFVDVLDRGWYRHVRFGNDPASMETWPPIRMTPQLPPHMRPTGPDPLGLLGRRPPPLQSLGRIPRAQR